MGIYFSSDVLGKREIIWEVICSKKVFLILTVLLVIFFMSFSIAYAKDYNLKEAKVYYFIYSK
jgi:hypothetical protein